MQTALRSSTAQQSAAAGRRALTAVRPAMVAPVRQASVAKPSEAKQARNVKMCAEFTATAEPLLLVGEEQNDLQARASLVQEHFPTAQGVDDFMARLETVMAGYGFTGDNTIAVTNLCRDEVTAILKEKIEAAFGASFNTNGLGGVLTCGVTGMGAGLSHSPTCVTTGRERYIFFSFPHIAIDSEGKVGAISRPGRGGASCACGALLKCLGEFKKEGYACNCKPPGVHDAMDPEYSILKQRLARRLKLERANTDELNLVELTAIAERTITSDLEFLIEKSVDITKADYAVVTGVQIHNWAADLETNTPSMEMVAPSKIYVCVGGQKIALDLNKVPSMSSRQLTLLGDYSKARSQGNLLEVPKDYLMKEVGGMKQTYRVLGSPSPLAAPASLPGSSAPAAAAAASTPAPAAPEAAAAPEEAAPAPAPAPVMGKAEEVAVLEKMLEASPKEEPKAAAAAATPAPAPKEEPKKWFGIF